MKIALKTNQPERKLVAVINSTDTGFWTKDYYIYSKGLVEKSAYTYLEEALKSGKNTPVYEGDSITITF